MSPDFLCVAETTSAADALDAIRRSNAPPEVLSSVFACDPDGAVTGMASVVNVLQSRSLVPP